MKTAQKNNNSYTINLNDDIKKEIEVLAAAYQRKPAELLRLLLVPAIINKYAELMQQQHPENKTPATVAAFRM